MSNISVLNSNETFFMDFLIVKRHIRAYFELKNKNEVINLSQDLEKNFLKICILAEEIVNRKNGKFIKSKIQVPFSRRESLKLKRNKKPEF